MTGLVASTEKSLGELMELNFERQKHREKYFQLWCEAGIDVMLSLPASHTATPLDKWSSITYTAILNFMDCPSCVLPLGHVKDSDIVDGVENAKYGPEDAAVYILCKLSVITLTHMLTSPRYWTT